MNRLTTAAGGGYSYDAAGNLLGITGPPPTKPSIPIPGSGSTGISRLPTLAWTAAQNASGLTLYVSSSSTPTVGNSLLQVGLGGTATFYSIASALPYNTPLYWRVDAFNGAGQTTTGDVWSFTTLVNTAPTVSSIAAQSTNEDVAISGVAFTLGDGQTALDSLVLDITSSDTTLVPNASISLSGTGANRSLSIQPVGNKFGTTTITVKATDDGGLFDSKQFVLTVNSVNDLPSITDITNQTINEDAATAALAFTVGDIETAAASLNVTASSSDTTLVPNAPANLTFGGSGANRTLTVMPAPNAFGASTITVTVTDGNGGTMTDTFVLTVNSVNDAPTISAIADQAILPSTTTGPLSFTIGDVETAANSLILTPASNNLTLVPTSNIVLGGIGSLRTVTVTPVAGQTGLATITISVSDGTATTPISFLLRVSNNNTNLASLVLSSGNLSPSFASATTTYTATIGNTVPSITVTPTVVDANATVRVNGNLVTSGGTSGAITLSVGSNPVITVLVTAQDSSTKTYSITPTKNPLPVATTLDATSISSSSATLNGTVNPQGASTTVTFRYGTTTAYGSTANVTGSPFTGSSGTSVSAALTGLLPGTLYHYQVLAANSTDSTPGADMTFPTVSDNARLASLALSAGSITFQPDTLSYSITVPNSPANLTLTPTVQQANATLKINTVSAPSGTGTSVPLALGDNAIVLLVTAQDGITTRTYTLNVRRRSTDATLASLSLTGVTLNPAFATGITSYTATVPFLTTSTTLAATTTHGSAVVTSGSGLRNLVVGANALSVLVTAEDGNTQTYTVTVTRSPASTNASLAGLTLSAGTLTPAFASGTFTYSATVAANVTSVTVTPTVQQANATLTIQGTSGASGVGRVVSLVTGDNVIPIVVTAQDGTTAQDYSITIRQRSVVADLASLSLSGVTLSPVFSSGTIAYTATVSNATASTTITAAATHASATIAGGGLRSLNIGSNPLTVTVTAEDGNTKDYTVTVLRNPLPVAVTTAATNFAALSTTLNGSINAGGVSTTVAFEYGTSTTYGQTVAGIPASVSSSSAAPVSAALTNLIPGTLYHFRVKGTNSTDSIPGDDRTFTTLRNNASLSALALSAGTLAFDPLVVTYNVSVANAVNSITVTPTVADSAATVKVNNVSVVSGETSAAITLVEGMNPTINVLVTAEDGTTKNYAVIYNRLLMPLPVALAATEVSKSMARLNGTVNARGTSTTGTFEYGLDPSLNTFTTASATPGTVSGTTTTSIVANVTGLIPNSVYYYRIRAVSAGGTQFSGTQTFTTSLNDAYLTNLTTSFGSLSPFFSPTATAYTASVGYDTFWVVFNPTAPTPSVLITVNGSSVNSGNNSPSINLTTGDNTITVIVTDSELSVSRTYTITVTRQTGPPSIVTQPLSQFAFVGMPMSFSPQFNGAGPLSYVWKKNNVILKGATLARYDIPVVTAAHAGRYVVEVTNSLGKRTSNEAMLGVITRPPSQVNVLEKGTLTLAAPAVAPTGVKLTYEWWRAITPLSNGGRISGTNTATMRITGMVAEDENSYWCYISMRAADGSLIAEGYTEGTGVQLTEIPEIYEGPLPDGAVSALYSTGFPFDSMSARKTPSSYSATGLPAGLKCDPKTGDISGRPTAARKDKFGAVIPYDVTLTARNAKGADTLKTTLRIEPLPDSAVGNFAASLNRHAGLNGGLGGRLDMTVLSTGSLTGKVVLGTATWPFTGVLDGGSEPTGTLIIKRKIGEAPLKFSFSLFNGYIDGLLDDNVHSLYFSGSRQVGAANTNLYAGYYTFSILPAGYSSNLPHGAGYGSFTVSKTGTLALTGRTADGEAITGGSFVGVDGSIVVYQTLYTTVQKGSLQGYLRISNLFSDKDLSDWSALSWMRPKNTAITARLFVDGFGPENLRIRGSEYTPPLTGQIVMGLSDVAGNAGIYFSPYTSQSLSFYPDITLRIKSGGVVTLPLPADNPAKTSLSIVPATGAFSGGFTLVDPNPLPPPALPRVITRSVRYQGIIFNDRNSSVSIGGGGYFLLPELPSTDSANVNLTPIIPGNIYLWPQ